MSSIFSWASSWSSWERALGRKSQLPLISFQVCHENKISKNIYIYIQRLSENALISCVRGCAYVTCLSMFAVAFLSWGRRSGSLNTSSSRQITPIFSSPFISKSWNPPHTHIESHRIAIHKHERPTPGPAPRGGGHEGASPPHSRWVWK